MTSNILKMDELVKEYLMHRGFISSLKQLEIESKQDKDKGYRVERIVEQLQSSISGHDLSTLRDLWTFLDQRIFCRLEQSYNTSVRRLHVNLLKVYVITALQAGRSDKVSEFFDKLGAELYGQAEWKEWFVLPFIKSPEENPAFQTYFSKQWQDTLYLSLHNFLNVVIHSMPVPTLLSYEEDQKKMSALRDKVQQQQQQLSRLREQTDSGSLSQQGSISLMSPTSTADIDFVDTQDDFYVLSQDTSLPEQAKPAKKFFNFALPSSPVLPKKPTPPTAIPKPPLRTKSRENPPPASRRTGMLAQEDEERRKAPTPTKRSPLPPASDDNAGPADQSAPPILAPPTVAPPTLETGDTGTITKSGRSKFYLHHYPDPPLSGPGERDVSSSAAAACGGAGGGFLLMSQEEFKEHQSSITHCRFSHSANMAASVDVDGVVKVWSVPNPVTTASIMSKAMLLSLEWLSNQERLLLLGSKAGSIRLFDIEEKKIVSETQREQAFPRIVWLASSPDGKQFVRSASGRLSGAPADPGTPRPGNLSLWDTATFTQQRCFPTLPQPVAINCSAYNRSGTLLVTGAADGKIRLFDIAAGESVQKWQAHQGEVYTVSFSASENSVYSMGSDAKFCHWSLSGSGQQQQQQELSIHEGACGPFVLTGGGGYRQVQTPKGRLFSFDSQGKHVLTCGADGGVVYQVEDGNVRRCLGLGGHNTPVVTLDWSAAVDTKMCLTGSMDGKVRLSTLLAQN